MGFSAFVVGVLVLRLGLLVSVRCQDVIIPGESIYQDLVEDWAFAYRVASDIEVDYNTVTTVQPEDTLSILSDYTIGNLTVTDPNIFLCPLVAYPLAIVYNMPIYSTNPNDTLLLTEHLVSRLLTEQLMKWNDPELVLYNPFLATNFISTRMVLVNQPSPITAALMRQFPINTTNNSTDNWLGNVAPKHIGVNTYVQVVSEISILTNAIAFVPLPTLRSYGGTIRHLSKEHLTFVLGANIQLARLVRYVEATNPGENDTMVTIGVDTSFVSVVSEGDYGNSLIASVVPGNLTWPLYLFGYLAFDQNPAALLVSLSTAMLALNSSNSSIAFDLALSSNISPCTNDVDPLRFFYWVYGNDYLYNQTLDKGFCYLNGDSYTMMKQHLLNASCDGTTILTYDNLSVGSRSIGLFIGSIVAVVLFMVVTALCWWFHPKRTYPMLILYFILVFIGLGCSLTGFILWGYHASSDTFCVGRVWFMGFGYLNLVMAVIFAPLFSIVATKVSATIELKRESRLPWIFLVLSYFVLEVIELVILLSWTLGERPSSVETVVDTIQWQTRWECTNNDAVSTSGIVQYVYFCLISVFGWFVTYRYWKLGHLGDTRFTLFAMFSQIALFGGLLAMTRAETSGSLTDDQVYVIVVVGYLLAEVNVVLAYFLPQLIKRSQQYLSGRTSIIPPPGDSDRTRRTTVESIGSGGSNGGSVPVSPNSSFSNLPLASGMRGRGGQDSGGESRSAAVSRSSSSTRTQIASRTPSTSVDLGPSELSSNALDATIDNRHPSLYPTINGIIGTIESKRRSIRENAPEIPMELVIPAGYDKGMPSASEIESESDTESADAVDLP